MKKYGTEARSRWGKTNAYREYEQKIKNYTKEKWAEINEGLMTLFAEFAEFKNKGQATLCFGEGVPSRWLLFDWRNRHALWL